MSGFSENPMKGKGFVSLEAGRFLAAVLVAAVHASGTVATFHGYHPLDDFFRGGHSGVEYFFVLSGFLMYWMHAGEFGQGEAGRRFVLKRAIRIFPLYWMIVGLYALLAIFAPGVGKERAADMLTIVGNFFLLVPVSALFLGVAWTLQRELVFYGIFAFAFLGRRVGIWPFWLWQGAIIIANLLSPEWSAGTRGTLLLGVYNLGFGVGVAIAMLTRRFRMPQPAILATMLVGGTIWITAFLVEWWTSAGLSHDRVALGDISSPLIYLAGTGLVILAFVQYEQRVTLRKSRILSVLGDSSYALYLVHPIIISVLVRVLHPEQGILASNMMFLFVLAASVGAAVTVHLLLEKPLLGMLRRALLARRETVVPLARLEGRA